MFEQLPDAPSDFHVCVLSHAIAALKLNTLSDNFDAARFNYDGGDHSKDFNIAERTYFFDWFFRNTDKLFGAYMSLDDEESRRLYMYLIAYRLCGHLCVRLPVDFQGADEYRRRELRSGSRLALGGAFSNLEHLDFDFNGSRYRVDCFGLEYYLHRRQYFLDRGDVTVRPEPGDVVIDGGACLGDTAAVFSNAVGRLGHVYAFDPVAEHLGILRHNAGQFPIANVTVMPFGLSSANVDADPIRLNAYAPGFDSTNALVPLRAIDSLVEAGQIDRIDFLKLDVEGSEADALTGAARAIAKYRPKLAISLYHKPDDLFELIGFVKDRFDFYDLHIGHYTIQREETVLYCHPSH